MHYFKRNIGDYHKKAGRLSMLEHGAYTLLLDACYDRERFPTMDEALEWTWARTDDEISAVKFVLSKFFALVDGVYAQQRVQDEIDSFHAKSLKNQEIALAREAARRALRERNEHETCTDHHLTTNQEPLTTNQEEIKSSSDQASPDNAKAPAIPFAEIMQAYRAALPDLPQPQAMTEKRKTAIRGIWREFKKSHEDDFWPRYFAYVAKSEFLVSMKGIGIDWLINKANFFKVIEGNYHHA